MDNETRAMLSEFVAEGFDALDNSESLIESLSSLDNLEQVNAIFRVFHTLKGLSGFFEMKVINKVTHNAETLLDLMRKSDKPQSEDNISIIYQTYDLLRELLQRVSTEFNDESGIETADDLIVLIKTSIQNFSGETEIDPFDELMADLDAVVPKDFDDNDDIDIESENNETSAEKSTVFENDLSSFISDDMVSQYLTSALELIELVENNLIILEKEPDNTPLVGETFGAIHSLKGNSGFMGFSEIEELSADIETILDSVRNKELEIDQNIVSILLSNVESIKRHLTSKKSNSNSNIAQNSTSKTSERKNKVDTQINLEDDDNEYEKAKTVQDKPGLNSDNNKPVPKENYKMKNVTSRVNTLQRTDIRVETNKIDKLFDLVGELITIESMVTNSPDLKGLELSLFSKSANMLNKITRELQEISMSIRMMPIDGLFNKMKRLVRDVSIKMDKKINLDISGQDTEMDKNVIDEIADPLVHILRNAIDHGIESPETRLEKGKAENGNISLSAKYEGNEILIIIKDDGAGINKEAVLNKAIEKGLVSGNVDKLSDKEVFMLIFEPGFSTAKALTDISGRGVGMDVVKKNIEKLRGNIDIESKQGKGSVFTLRIPLTLAIMEAMLIRVGESIYALPILSLRESFRANPDSITTTMDGLEVVNIRQEILPVIRIHEILNIEPDSNNLQDGILMIIETREKRVCLFADEIVGQQQAVIKGLSDFIGKVSGITGCMILGDGSIGLILDVEGLIAMAEMPVLA